MKTTAFNLVAPAINSTFNTANAIKSSTVPPSPLQAEGWALFCSDMTCSGNCGFYAINNPNGLKQSKGNR